MSLETDTNTKGTYQIGMDMLYQADIANYIKIIIEFKQSLRKSYTVVWDFCNKYLQNLIETNVDSETKIQDKTTELLKSIKILMHEPK